MSAFTLTVGLGGWCVLEGDGYRAMVRFQERAGRLAASEVRVVAEERVTGNILRQALPLGRIEAVANSPARRGRILAAIQQGGERADQATAAWEEAVQVSPEAASVAAIRAPFFADPRKVAAKNRVIRELREGKHQPGEGRREDDFYREVANVYMRLSGSTRHAAQVMAEAGNVPRVRVYRWLREARARGLLAEAPRRKR